MMVPFQNIRDPRELGDGTNGYLVTLDMDFGDGWEEGPYVARPGRGEMADAIIAEIVAGNYTGDIEPIPEPEVDPLAGTFSKARMIAAMTSDEFTLFMAAIAALPAQTQEIYRQSAELERDPAGLFESMVDDMIAAWGADRTTELLTAARTSG